MITDAISNSHLYSALNPRLSRAFDYIQQTDLPALSVGKYVIDGEDIYALVQEYDARPREEGVWEAHRRYIDLQVVIRGVEQFGYAHIGNLTPGDYDAAKDWLPLSGEGDFFRLQAGYFAIFMPEDAHMPGLAAGPHTAVKKLVVKISTP
ncbi:MAG: YhcH/YjgK/YiaL family protein [Anaerolineae bacterium]|nr:MAG: YhcH/YjgK/YiaL family protein [Anaerolineae bacterium]